MASQLRAGVSGQRIQVCLAANVRHRELAISTFPRTNPDLRQLIAIRVRKNAEHLRQRVGEQRREHEDVQGAGFRGTLRSQLCLGQRRLKMSSAGRSGGAACAGGRDPLALWHADTHTSAHTRLLRSARPALIERPRRILFDTHHHTRRASGAWMEADGRDHSPCSRQAA